MGIVEESPKSLEFIHYLGITSLLRALQRICEDKGDLNYLEKNFAGLSSICNAHAGFPFNSACLPLSSTRIYEKLHDLHDVSVASLIAHLHYRNSCLLAV